MNITVKTSEQFYKDCDEDAFERTGWIYNSTNSHPGQYFAYVNNNEENIAGIGDTPYSAVGYLILVLARSTCGSANRTGLHVTEDTEKFLQEYEGD